MNINPLNNLMFFHVPKNAGKSILKAFELKKVKEINRSTVCGLSIEFVMENIDGDSQTKTWLKSLTKFAIIRNPYDRLVSLYHFRKKENDLYNLFVGANPNGGDKTSPDGKNLSFKEWVMDSRSRGLGLLWDKDPFIGINKERQVLLYDNDKPSYDASLEWINQIHFITDRNGKLMIDDVLRFENLDEEIKNFCKKYNLNEVVLPKKNSSLRKKHYVDYYDDELIEFATRLFEDDLEYFNYKFGE